MTTLRTFRLGFGYEQQKLADRVHISPGYLCDLEHGLKKPSRFVAVVIANIFGVKPEIVFPDGYAEKVCRQRAVDTGYRPPETPPPPLVLRCWKCGAVRISYRPFCYQCGAEFERRVEEGA